MSDDRYLSLEINDVPVLAGNLRDFSIPGSSDRLQVTSLKNGNSTLLTGSRQTPDRGMSLRVGTNIPASAYGPWFGNGDLALSIYWWSHFKSWLISDGNVPNKKQGNQCHAMRVPSAPYILRDFFLNSRSCFEERFYLTYRVYNVLNTFPLSYAFKCGYAFCALFFISIGKNIVFISNLCHSSCYVVLISHPHPILYLK